MFNRETLQDLKIITFFNLPASRQLLGHVQTSAAMQYVVQKIVLPSDQWEIQRKQRHQELANKKNKALVGGCANV